MTRSTDPITKAEQGVWQMLIQHKPLMDLVAVNNRHYTSGAEQNPFGLNNPTSADLPELLMFPVSTDYQDHQGRWATSDAFFISKTWELRIHTDKWNAGDESGIHPIEYECFIAIMRLVAKNTKPVPGEPNIAYVRPESASQQVGVRGGTPDGSGGIAGGARGWHSLIRIRCTITVDRNSIGATP